MDIGLDDFYLEMVKTTQRLFVFKNCEPPSKIVRAVLNFLMVKVAALDHAIAVWLSGSNMGGAQLTLSFQVTNG